MTGWLRIVLAAQMLFFAAWGALLLTSHEEAGLVWLATEPVDPRDLLSGNYVALRYPIASPHVAECEALRSTQPTTVYVRLEPTGATVDTSEGPVVPSQVVACEVERPGPSAGGRWIAGRLEAGPRHQLVYGIERFYVAETSPLRAARSGSVIAKVRVNDAFEPRLIGLATIR